MKIFVLILILAFTVTAQTREQVLNQQLNHALDVLAVTEKVVKAQEAEISAKDEQIRLQSLLIESLNQSIETRDAQIKSLSAIKCDESGVKLFFVIKFTKKTCR